MDDRRDGDFHLPQKIVVADSVKIVHFDIKYVVVQVVWVPWEVREKGIPTE